MFSTKSLVHFVSFFLLLALILVPASPARAAGVRYAAPSAVGSGDCSSWANACTLQTALSVAVSGDQIWVKAGVYYPGAAGDRTATFTLRNGVALYGGFAGTETLLSQRNWSTNKTILSGDIDQNDTNTDGNYIAETTAAIVGNNAYHVVTGSGTNNTAVLDGFVITAGLATGSDPYNSGGGIYNNSGSPTLTNITFSGNAAYSGGGMINNWGSNPTLTAVTFSGNAALFGGGMANYNSSSPSLTSVTFSSNSATDRAGGMYNSSGSSPTLTNVTFSNNHASSYGGGMVNNSSSPALANVTFSGNTASNYGGGMVNASSSPTLTNVTFTNNSADDYGGGMVNSYSNPTLTHVTFSGNSSVYSTTSYGGGMVNDHSFPTLTDVTFSNNSASNGGGGMVNILSGPVLTNVTFSGNSAKEGGGMYNENSDATVLRNVTFRGNSASDYGGGMVNDISSPTLTNVTFSNNSASNYGGGMANFFSSPTLTNVTFSGNTASNSGGGMYNFISSNPTLTNVILWGDSAPNGPEIYNDGNSTPSISYSDIQGGYAGTGNINADPRFVDAAGGNLRLQLSSPAIDAGNNAAVPSGVTTDLDGNERFEDIPTISDTGSGTPPIVDMGAYEAQDTIPPTVTINQAAGQADPTHATPILFTAVFNEPINTATFTTADVSLSGTAPGATVASVTEIAPNDGTTFEIAVNGMTGDGTVSASIPAGGVQDLAGNTNAASTSTDNTVTYDTTAPALTSFTRFNPPASPTSADVLVFRAAFSKDVQNVDAADFTINAAPATTAAITGVTPVSASLYEITVSGGDLAAYNGVIGLNLAAAQNITDLANNPLPTVEPATDETYTVDNTVPTVAILDLQANYVGAGPAFFVVQFNMPVADLPGHADPDDVTNPANYLLIEKGPNGATDTLSCAAGLSGDDLQQTVTAVSYDNTTFTSTVTLAGALPVGNYRLFICGTTSIVSLANVPLNNGSDSTFDFTVSRAQLPSTGFPMGRVTQLAPQPAEKAYAAYDELTLEIPSLGIKTSIVGVPQTSDGWDVSWLGNLVGWLEGSAFPTWPGNTVLTGHVWNADNTPGIFAGIKNLKYGDRFILRAFGQTYVYEVRENTWVRGSSASKVFKHEEYDWVTLLTCEGYNPLTSKYLFRRMVRAVLVEIK
jgi:LPXTG-site transpeptidase (sortase) family protein